MNEDRLFIRLYITLVVCCVIWLALLLIYAPHPIAGVFPFLSWIFLAFIFTVEEKVNEDVPET